MLPRPIFGLLMCLSLLLHGAPMLQKEVTYAVRGRVIDSSGHRVVGASVFLDPPVWAHQVSGATTDDSGRFQLEETTTVPRDRRRLYVTGPEPENAVRLIYPPFNLLSRLTDSKFAGLPLRLEKNQELDVGDVLIQVSYSPVSVYVQDRKGSPMLTTAEQWKSAYLRLRDEKNSIVTESSLSQNNIENAVNLAKSRITVALPEGVWRLELSTDGYEGPWITSISQLNVKALSGPLDITLRLGPG